MMTSESEALMRDPHDSDDPPPDADFSEDFCRLLREGLVQVVGADVDAPLRFLVTPRGRAELQAPIAEPTAALADVVESALRRGENVDVLIDALIDARVIET